jgi:hypothetical protein
MAIRLQLTLSICEVVELIAQPPARAGLSPIGKDHGIILEAGP